MTTILDQKQKIMSILNVFETGSIKGDYSNISVFEDGPNNMKQITYGRSQTTEWGGLPILVNEYIANKGQYADQLIPYTGKLGKVSLVGDKVLVETLKKAGSDPVMIKTQDAFFDKQYWAPAYKFMTDNGFTLPLAGLAIYDSYIHSGSIPVYLRNRFPENPPARKGNERVWVEQYLNTRKNWLSTHSRTILHKTVYRVNNMLTAIKENNWDLKKPFNANGIVVV